MAIGALLTWYFIAEATIETESPQDASEIALKAIEVAQNPKIENHFFEVLFRMLLAKANMAASDFDLAKIHIKTAIDVAKKYGLNDLLSRSYLLYGKYFQELGLAQSDTQTEYLKGAREMFELSSNLVKQTHNTHVQVELEQAKSVLKSFISTNKIRI